MARQLTRAPPAPPAVFFTNSGASPSIAPAHAMAPPSYCAELPRNWAPSNVRRGGTPNGVRLQILFLIGRPTYMTAPPMRAEFPSNLVCDTVSRDPVA